MSLAAQSSGRRAEEGGEKKCLNSELWHACAGPLVCLPNVGTRVVYFSQGHSEQVVVSTNREVEGHIPNYPNLPPQLICQLHEVTMHADSETDEVYAQMTLQPLNPQEQKEAYLPAEMGIVSKQPTNYFCKTLTASDTSTHGGFSVPRRAAEKVFPPLDFSQQPPAQELIAKDIHGVEWKFRHIFRGQPKRHLLTTGWSVFVSAKKLVAGDSVLFIWTENNQLLLGIRHANRPQTVMPSSVLSSDSMHIGLLAAAAHAAATNSRFTIFYNPRASPSEFVIPLAKYVKAVFHTRVSVGMRFRMLFETEESSVRRYMGTITGISDLDPARWPNSHWRSVKVGWDESTAGDRQPRVSLWEIEPLMTFPLYPSLFPLRLKQPWYPGVSPLHDYNVDGANPFMWMRGNAGDGGFRSLDFQSPGIGPWAQQRLDPLLGNNHDHYQAMAAAALQEMGGTDALKQHFIQFQQSFPFAQQPCVTSPLLQQQMVQQAQIMNAQSQCVSENQTNNIMNQQLQQQHNEQQKQAQRPHSFSEAFQIPSNHMEKQQSPFRTSLSQKLVFSDSTPNFSSVLTSSCGQNILGYTYPEGSSNVLDFSSLSQSMMSDQHQQPWEPKLTSSQITNFGNNVSLPPFPGKDSSLEIENCRADMQNRTLFGANINSSNLLNNAVPSLMSSNIVDTDVSTVPYAASYIQNSLYGTGLILIHSAYKGEGHLLSVCNPTTKEHHVVSLPQQPHLSNLHLAFDPSRSAYFQVTGIGKIQDAYKIQIYSSGTLSLKAVDGVDVDTADLLCRCRCVYWNGYFVYLDMGLMDSPFYLLDVGGECLGRLPRPRKEICMYFGESGGRLHFIARPETGTSFDVMEMEANSTEWLVLCRVDIGHIRDVYPEVDRNVLSFNLNEASIWDVYPEVEVDMDNRPFFGTNEVSTVYFMREDRNGGDQLLLSIPGKIVAFHIRNKSFTTVCHGHPSKSTYSCNQFYPHAHTLFSLNSGSPQNDWVCWTRSHDKLLIGLMLQHSPDGRHKHGIVFTSQVWDDMVRKFNEVTKLNYDVAQLKRRRLSYNQEYQLVKNLLKSRMGFKWDDSLQMVIAGDATWSQYIEADPEAIVFRGRKVPFSELKRIFGYV